MTDILTLVFRTFMSRTNTKKELTSGTSSIAAYSTLVVGNQSISRSVLLLAAVTAASELGIKVVFFTRTQIQSLPASLQKCIPSLSPESLKKIKFSYPRTLEELLQQVACLHEPTNTTPTPPSLVIVDRLECFLRGDRLEAHGGLHPGVQSRAAHVSALLCDTAAFLTRVLEQRAPGSGPCRVVASFHPEEDGAAARAGADATDPALDVLDRYFQVRCTLEPERGYGAAAAAAQEAWRVYLSGRDQDSQEEAAVLVAQEWQLLIFPDGLMEFKLV